MKKHLKKLSLLFAVAMVLIVSCSKEEAVGSVNQNGGQIFRLQVVTATLPGVSLTDLEYQGTIDGEVIKLSKSANDKLTFIVPASTSLGLKDLIIPVLNNAVIHYDIKETTLTQTATETLSPLFVNLNASPLSLDTSAEAIECKVALESFNNYYSNATDAQKTEMALIYKANKLLFDSIILDTYSGRPAVSNTDCLAIAVLGMGASVALIVSPTGAGQILGLGLFAISLVKAKKCGKPLYDEYVMAENIIINDFIGVADRRVSSSIVFRNDIASNVTLNIFKRKLIASDSTKTQSTWVSFFSSFNLMNANILAVNYVISVLNKLPFVNFPSFVIVKLPSTSPKESTAVNTGIFKNFTFKVSHPNLTLVSNSLEDNGQLNLKIKIKNTPASLPVESFLSYSYSDDFNSFSGKLPITVEMVSTDEVVIGTQVWKTRNLDVSKYRNGDPIPQVTDATQWKNLTTGAWCYYTNMTENGAIYGKLYNWYAVNDPRGLAPEGYHVPSDAEWTTLVNFLGGEDFAGIQMKSTTWKPYSNITNTNSSGFTALPGGRRLGEDGAFIGIYDNGSWWTSSGNDATNVWKRSLSFNSDSVGRLGNGKVTGNSVRCIKD